MVIYPLLEPLALDFRNSMELAKLESTSLYPLIASDVAPRVETALASIESMNDSFKAFNRSHSDVAWNAMVLDEESDTRNLRQISAEIKRKRDALVEVNFTYRKNMLQAKIHEDKADKLNGLESEMELLLAQEQRSKAQLTHESIMGATKDIEALKSSYDKIHTRILEKHGHMDEQVFEQEERGYWIRRAFKQSMQDVRERGNIGKGEQMLLEQIGIEPKEALKDIKGYLQFIDNALNEGKTIDQGTRKDFFDQMELKHINKIDTKLALMGNTQDHLYIEGK